MENNFLQPSIDAAKKAGDYILKQLESEIVVEKKQLNDFVTQIDKKSEEIIIAELVNKFPDFGFLAEESSSINFSKDKPYWIIDPLDGTTNFIHKFPAFCVSIGLCVGKEPLTGVVYDPIHNDLFYAQKDKGAFLNGNKIQVSKYCMPDAMIATGFPFRSHLIMDQYMECFKKVLYNCHDIRRAGSAALDLCYVACGKLDGYWEYGIHPWDVAAGIIILKEAGGLISDFTGGEDYLYSRTLVASNNIIFKELQNIVINYMPNKHHDKI